MEENKLHTNKEGFKIELNSIKNAGDGYVTFSRKLPITDSSEQRNGTKYDIESMDISEYDGKLTANHSMDIQEIIGKVVGLAKENNKITIKGIQFAVKENALAKLAYDLLIGGYLTDFSIETFGPWPDDDGVYRNAKLVGLSAVVIGNNRSARLNEFVINSIESAKADGLDTEEVEKLCYNKLNDIKISKPNMEEPKTVEAPKAEALTSEQMAEAVKNAVAPLVEKVKELEQKVFDNSAKEPEFKNAQKSVSNELDGMNYKERHAKQINFAWDMLKGGNMSAGQKLADINKFHLEKLQESGIVSNSIGLSEMGNFVISPELLSDIEGHRSDFTPLISRLNFQETLSLQMAWLARSGDINMQEVALEPDEEGTGDENLKPISEYGAEIKTSNLHELAAVTPVCNSATRFLAADLLGDVAAGYRNDFDRKRAQLYIARLQQAVNSTGNVQTYSTVSDLTSLKSFIDTWSYMTEEIPNGTFIFNFKTYGELVRRVVGAGISGGLAGVFTTGDQPTILGRPYIVVPNELLPALNTATTKTFVVEGVSVTINRAVFYTDLATFSGRTSGGLQYDLSTEAAYEDGETVKSAFQRNELVLRGSFFRGGAVRDINKVVAMGAPGVS